MEKEFVTYELALRMKALGYDEPCFAYFLNSILQYPAWEKDYSYFNEMSDINPSLKKHEHVLAPTYSQVFRWFREKHKLYHCIQYSGKDYVAYTHNVNGMTKYSFDTYEEAELECLKKLIEIVKS